VVVPINPRVRVRALALEWVPFERAVVTGPGSPVYMTHTIAVHIMTLAMGCEAQNRTPMTGVILTPPSIVAVSLRRHSAPTHWP
jgi:hypothetical protein